MLEDLGHKVTTAYSGREALEMLAKMPAVDLVISDYAMPGMTGTDLAAKVRLERPSLPILMTTGYAELPNGEGTYIPRLDKPFLQANLQRAVADAVRRL